MKTNFAANIWLSQKYCVSLQPHNIIITGYGKDKTENKRTPERKRNDTNRVGRKTWNNSYIS